MDLSGIGIWSGELRYGDEAEKREAVAELQELGYTAAWIPDVGGDVLGIAATSTKVDQAWDFMAWSLSDAAQVEVLAKHKDLIARTDLAENKYSAADPRVVSLEETDARYLTATLLGEPPMLVVCDASFIGLAKLLGRPLSLAADRAELVTLFKPQFEVGAGRAKKGIVRDPVIHTAVCDDVAKFVASLGWRVLGVVPSPIEGGDGNVEFLLGAARD